MGKSIKFTKETKKVLWIGIGIIAALFAYIIGTHSSFEEDLKALKPVARESQVSLSVFMETQVGVYEAVAEKVNYGGKLVFELSTNLPIHVSLLSKADEGKTEVILKSARIPPGKNKSLDRHGKPFIYQVLDKQKTRKFCIVYAASEDHLRLAVSELINDWSHLPSLQCVSIKTPS